MGRPYSQDLRERVVEAAATTSRRQAAARFGSVSRPRSAGWPRSRRPGRWRPVRKV
jgi:transposase